MKRVLALACAVLGLTAGAAAAGERGMPRPVGVAIGEPTGWPPRYGDVLVVDGWRLPVTHAYQAQDDYGVYHPVRPADVPLAILRGKEVYDLTARAWVNHPTAYAATGGRNPAYVAAAVGGPRDGWGGRRDGWDELRGRIERVDRERLTLRTDDGRRVVVDTSDARMTFRPDRGDRVVALGTNGGRGDFDARYVTEERPAR